MTDNPFAAIAGLGGAARSFWGPSENERMLDRKLGAVQAKDDTEQARLQELGAVWSKMVEDAGGDVNIAQKQFITSPEFFRLGGDSVQSMLKTFKEITEPKLHNVTEGQHVVSPSKVGADGQLTPLYKYDKPPEAAGLSEESKIDLKEQAKHGATIMQKVYEDASAARLDKPRFDQLREIVANNPGGIGTWLKGFLAERGVPVQGKSDLDLWTAMLNQAAPRTREPGSGVFTDKDFDAAIRGLPNMLKSRSANIDLADMALDLIEYRINRGGPAAGYLSGDKTRKQAFDEINKVGMKRKAQKGRLKYNAETGDLE